MRLVPVFILETHNPDEQQNIFSSFSRRIMRFYYKIKMAIDRTKFDFSTAVALRLKPNCATVVLHVSSTTCIGFKRRATAVQSSVHKL